MNQTTVQLQRPQRVLTTEKMKWNSKIIVICAIMITVVDMIYMNLMGIGALNHEACIIYESMPKWLFYLYENVFELLVVVLLGVFAGVIMEQYFHKIKRFYPKNQLLAFAYASILPVCSCGVVPLVESMKNRTSLKVITTFIVAAPLLNPYIIFVSFTVLGLKYAVLRIIFSCFLAIASGSILEFISSRFNSLNWGEYKACVNDCKVVADRDPFVKAVKITKQLVPYILIAGLISFTFSIWNPRQYLEGLSFSHEPWATLIMTVIGIPIYVCNGTDVLFLKPLLQYTDLTMGSAMAFSLTSSAVCTSSIVMLVKFIGRNLTIALVSIVFILSIASSMIINLLF